MLTVKFNNGSGLGDNEFTIENVEQFRQFQNVLISEFIESEVERRIENEAIDCREELEQILEASDYDNADDLIEWIEKMQEIERDIDDSDYDDISEMTDRIEQLENAIDDIYYQAQDVRR